VYDAKSPADIKFVPLDKKEEMDANKLMEFYEVLIVYAGDNFS